MKLTLTHEGAEALREFAGALPIAIDNIVTETGVLLNVYSAISERLGEHGQDFSDLLMHIKKAQQTALDAVAELPPKMEATASKIDSYVAARPKLD